MLRQPRGGLFIYSSRNYPLDIFFLSPFTKISENNCTSQHKNQSNMDWIENKVNKAAGGGKASEKNEDSLDKGFSNHWAVWIHPK